MKKLALSFLLWLAATITALAGQVREITFYCGCPKCCGIWSKHNRTKSGTVPQAGRTIAANNIPMGSLVFIPSIGYRTVEDTLAQKFRHRLDVFEKDHLTALRLGVKRLPVYILRFGPPSDKNRLQ